jgi:hypothetical protein
MPLFKMTCTTMSHPGFGHLWQQAEKSDVDIAVAVSPPGVESASGQACEAGNHAVLQQFPGHSLILSLCPYLNVQVNRTCNCTLVTVISSWALHTAAGNTQQLKKCHTTAVGRLGPLAAQEYICNIHAAFNMSIFQVCVLPALLLSHMTTCTAVTATEQQPSSRRQRHSREQRQAPSKAAGHHNTARCKP